MAGDARSRDPIEETLAKTGIAPDLIAAMQTQAAKREAPSAGTEAVAPAEAGGVAPPKPDLFSVIIEMNTGFPGGAKLARAMLLKQFLKERGKTRVPEASLARHAFTRLRVPPLPPELLPIFAPDDRLAIANSLFTDHYLFCDVSNETIGKLDALSIAGAGKANKPANSAPLYKVWLDHPVSPLVFVSARTIKSDVARSAFAAAGRDIVWAVGDTGIDGDHPHFKTHETLLLKDGLKHRDFTDVYLTDAQASKAALTDEVGHGTHVAGIIAGETRPAGKRKIKIKQSVRMNDTNNEVGTTYQERTDPIQGLRPIARS